jgi:hypothetical protein
MMHELNAKRGGVDYYASWKEAQGLWRDSLERESLLRCEHLALRRKYERLCAGISITGLTVALCVIALIAWQP